MEGDLKWEDKTGSLGAMPPVESRGKALGRNLGALPSEADDTL